MKDWKVLGAAVAIVKEGKVILSKGYGLRDVKGNLPVTEQTMFPIASITKSFTITSGLPVTREQSEIDCASAVL